jgi:hypothetical protein
MNSDTTSILDLPTNPAGGGTIGGNVSMSINENHVIPQQQHPNYTTQNMDNSVSASPGMTLDQHTISQIVNGLQQASVTGATQLQSRDIPRNTENITHDVEVQPDYIPNDPNNQEYIKENDDNEDIIYEHNRRENQRDKLDQLYEEIQIPLLLSVLYFLFQLPIFKKYLFLYFPILFSKDGNININGYLFTSIIFGLLYYILHKIINNFNYL